MIHLTPEMLAQSYELLRLTLPFRRWGLPPAGEVRFRVNNSTLLRGSFQKLNKPTIVISNRYHGTLPGLLTTMAHEMVHLHEDTALKARRDVMHSRRFYQLAASVCKHHSIDEKTF